MAWSAHGLLICGRAGWGKAVCAQVRSACRHGVEAGGLCSYLGVVSGPPGAQR
jgi:hypothetical protein